VNWWCRRFLTLRFDDSEILWKAWGPLRATAIELTASGMEVAAARKVNPEMIVGTLGQKRVSVKVINGTCAQSSSIQFKPTFQFISSFLTMSLKSWSLEITEHIITSLNSNNFNNCFWGRSPYNRSYLSHGRLNNWWKRWNFGALAADLHITKPTKPFAAWMQFQSTKPEGRRNFRSKAKKDQRRPYTTSVPCGAKASACLNWFQFQIRHKLTQWPCKHSMVRSRQGVVEGNVHREAQGPNDQTDSALWSFHEIVWLVILLNHKNPQKAFV